MITKELREYIEQSRESGFSDEAIMQALLAAGWQGDTIAKALSGNHVGAYSSEESQPSYSSLQAQDQQETPFTIPEDIAIVPELIKYIHDRLAIGSSKEDIRKSLIHARWQPHIVDIALARVHSPPKQHIVHVSQRTQQEEETMSFSFMVVVGIMILIVVGAGVLFAVRSSNQKSGSLFSTTRDEQRANDQKVIQDALKNYFGKEATYPLALPLLIPEYLSVVPRDPKGISYEYTLLENGRGYQLCINFERKPRECTTKGTKE